MLNYTPDDGYTEKGFIREVPGLHGDLRFTYRPMLAETRQRLLAQMDKMKPDASIIKLCDELAARIKTWDLIGCKNEAALISSDMVRRLRPSLLFKVWGIVIGTEPTDIAPEWSDGESQSQSLLEAEAAAGPSPIGDVRQAADEKNSAAG